MEKAGEAISMHCSVITRDEDLIQSHITHAAEVLSVTRQTIYNWMIKRRAIK